VDYETKRAWSGICKAKREIAWTALPPNVNDLELMEFMRPEAIDIDWPILQLHIPAMLHPGDEIFGNTGNEHPKYEYSGFTKELPATNFTDWPESIVVDYDVRPYKGGWRYERLTVYAPST